MKIKPFVFLFCGLFAIALTAADKLAVAEPVAKSGISKEETELLWNMLVDYKNGKYKELPWKLVAAIVFFFVYLLNPFDLIPDVFPILGFTDDLGVLGLVLAAFTSDIDAYKRWLANNGDSITKIG